MPDGSIASIRFAQLPILSTFSKVDGDCFSSSWHLGNNSVVIGFCRSAILDESALWNKV